MNKKILCFILFVVIIMVPMAVFVSQKLKKLPSGLSYRKDSRGDFKFLYDLTLSENKEQEIFKNIYELIDSAEDFVLLDFFLYNGDYDRENYSFPSLSQDLTDRILEKKKKSKDVEIVFITDPINSFYGSYETEQIKQLREAGVLVVESNLNEIKDANPIYTSLYRSYLKYIPSGRGHMPNLFYGEEKVSVGAYLKLLNFKANHRKVAISEKEAIVSSANPHDGSAYHSNIAFRVFGDVVGEILSSEKAVLKLSGVENNFETKTRGGTHTISVLTESKIRDSLLEEIKSASEGDRIYIGVFYLGHRGIIRELKSAAKRGVQVDVVLDVNKDAFGQEKIGIPNKPVAEELVNSGINVRWYRTSGEQFHSKLLVHENSSEVVAIGGSANFTRRNLDDLNLETDLLIRAEKNSPEVQKILSYIDKILNNEGANYTADYSEFKEEKWWKNLIYIIQESTGLSTF